MFILNLMNTIKDTYELILFYMYWSKKEENMETKYKYTVQCKVQIQYFNHFKEQHCRFEVCCLEFIY